MAVSRKLLAFSAFAALVVPIAGADAQDPKPTPCNGLLLKDAKGDQDMAPVGGGGAGSPIASPGPDNIDVRGLFFNLAPGADGKPVLTANIQIENLTKDIPAEAHEGEIRYLVNFGLQNGITSVSAILTDSGFRYVAQEAVDLPDPGGEVATAEIETKGAAFEGPEGVIQIEIPEAAGFTDGSEMTGVITRVSLGNRLTLFVSDQAPDGGTADAVTFTVKSCPPPPSSGGGGETPAAPGPSPQPAPSGGGSGQPAQQPQAGQPGPGLLPAFGPLTADVAVDKGKRSTARKRGLRARVRCSVQCKVAAVATIDKRTARKLKLGKKAVKIGTGKGDVVKPGRIPFFIKLTPKAKKALGRKGVKKFPLKVSFQITDAQGKQLKKITKKSTLR